MISWPGSLATDLAINFIARFARGIQVSAEPGLPRAIRRMAVG